MVPFYREDIKTQLIQDMIKKLLKILIQIKYVSIEIIKFSGNSISQAENHRISTPFKEK